MIFFCINICTKQIFCVSLHSDIIDVRQPLMADPHYVFRARMLCTLQYEAENRYIVIPL
jgi:hypothetical protein